MESLESLENYHALPSGGVDKGPCVKHISSMNFMTANPRIRTNPCPLVDRTDTREGVVRRIPNSPLPMLVTALRAM